MELRIRNLLTNLDLQTRLQRSQQASVDAVKDTRASFYRQYDTGRKTWLDVLNIQRELTDQQLQLVQSENNRLILSLRLAVLMGRLGRHCRASVDGVKHEMREPMQQIKSMAPEMHAMESAPLPGALLKQLF